MSILNEKNTNINKQKRVDELISEQKTAYTEALEAALTGTGNNVKLKYSIQRAALALEEICQLHGQGWMIQDVGAMVVRDLRHLGFPESKYKYVYEALSTYGSRFYKPIQHSSIKSVSGLTKSEELFYRTNAQKYYDALSVIKNLPNDYSNLLVRDIQTIVPQLIDAFDDNEKECKRLSILIDKNKNNDGFDGGPNQFEDIIKIQKPIPEIPKKLAEEFNIWIHKFLPALLKKVTDYPIKDDKLEAKMTAGWAAIRAAHDPSTDDKYRKTYYDWITIVEFADESFKHHAASHFKSQDFRGNWRKLTREQIGARQKTIPQWCKWFFETVPGFMEWIAWSREKREPYLSGFSIDLSPKLSDSSLR